MARPTVIYEDNHLLAINKPAGWLVQGDKTGDRTLLDWGKAYIKQKYDKPGAVFLNPTHRIDRPVSGIVLFARTSKALERVNKMFRDDQVSKTYLATVENRPEELNQTLTHYLLKDSDKNVTRAYTREKKSAKKSILSYEMIMHDLGHSLLKVMPKTGRPHQIRVQLSKINCPIQGDLKYGYPKPNQDKSISLHAFKLALTHPVKKEPIEIKCTPEGENWRPYIDTINELD